MPNYNTNARFVTGTSNCAACRITAVSFIFNILIWHWGKFVALVMYWQARPIHGSMHGSVFCSISLRCYSLHCIALHCTSLYCVALYCVALYCIALHSIVLYRIVSYANVSYRITLFCFLLFYLVLLWSGQVCFVLFVLHCFVWFGFLFCFVKFFIAIFHIALLCAALFCTVLLFVAMYWIYHEMMRATAAERIYSHAAPSSALVLADKSCGLDWP